MRDERGFLDRHSRQWVDDGVITAEQREQILARYPAEDKRHRQAALLSVLGAVLVGVGAILFVATNWEQIPRWLRFTVLVGATLGAHATGWALRERSGNYPRVGHAMYVLGSLLFGATLFLVAQMFQVNANAPGLLLLWLIGVAPMAWAMGSRPLLVLTIGLGGLWLGFQAVEWVQLASGQDVYEPVAIVAPLFAYGVLLWGLGRLHRTWSRLEGLGRFDPLLRGFGSLAIAGGLYVFTFDFGDVPRGETGVVFPLMLLLFAFLIVGLGALAWWAKDAKRHTTNAWLEAGTIGVLSLLMVLTYVAPEQAADAVLFNLVLAAAIIGLVIHGAHRGDELLINLGLMFFVVDVVTRYFDFFFDLLDRSIFFIVGGLLLIGGGWLLERQRKQLVERARQEGSA